MVRFLIQVALLFVVLIAAWRAGGKPERYVANIYAAMLVVSTSLEFLVSRSVNADYQSVYVVRFLIDLVALLAVVSVALAYERWWTLWVGSAQFIAVLAHVLQAMAMPIPALAYAVMERWPVWAAILLTGLGTYLHWRRQLETATDT